MLRASARQACLEIEGSWVDEIPCLSVNDAFVMNAWASQRQGRSSDAADGNGAFQWHGHASRQE